MSGSSPRSRRPNAASLAATGRHTGSLARFGLALADAGAWRGDGALQLRHQRIHLTQRLGHRIGQQLAPHLLALDGDLVDAGDADEPQRGRQVRLQMVHMRHRPSGAEAYAAPGGEDDRVPLPIRQHGHVGIKRVALVQPDRAVQAHH